MSLKTSINGLVAYVVCLVWMLPESSMGRLVRYSGLSRIGRWFSLKVNVVLAGAGIFGSVLGSRWKAGRGHSGAVAGIMGLFLIVIFVSYVIAPALVTFFGVATTTFSAGTAALWGVIGLFVVVAIILLIVSTTGML